MSFYLMPLRDRIAVNTEENAKMLRKKVEELREEKVGKRTNHKYQNTEIKKRANLKVSLSVFSRFMRAENSTLPEDDHKRLAYLLCDEGVFTKPNDVINRLIEIDNPLFHTLVDFLKSGSGTIEKACLSYPGIYKTWRPSSHWPGHFLLGALEIIQEDTCVIKTRETERFSGLDRAHPLIKVMDGYLFRKDGKIYILSSEEKCRKSLRLIILNSTSFGDDERAVVMEGIMVGVSKGKIFSTMVYIERWNDSPTTDIEFYKTLDIVKSDEVHELILSRLGLFRLESGLVSIG